MWEWDSSLYSGSAEYYARGRIAYPDAVADALVAEMRLDGSGRLLDVGCGPGSLTLLLANAVEQAIGLDADPGMIDEARRAGVPNAQWLHMRAEDLPAGLGRFRLITFAQSFHWLDRPRVAAAVRGSLPRGTAEGEAEIYRAAGFAELRRITVPGRVVTRVADDIVAAVFSLSSSTPHLFGDRRAEFESDLRRLLIDTSASGVFSEQAREIVIDLWRP
ncbi:methyltransferase domain-containing protein [Allokutzneria sp. A3M-2-11 16]|uniref:class I SAM-dependent methyltransferase n=1 Tax=Allokutzneria sp. A3M-2-11 16 TaxID=2962043 RepID=UPI0020B824A8|nr:class I SAM-dependent methyltransferase [Allokutzneria sp. A3M-2-11 16]MCP3804595.1 methyltransferase domain-containing protein [Allokutzneria sp. A3M-2-11 16]